MAYVDKVLGLFATVTGGAVMYFLIVRGLKWMPENFRLSFRMKKDDTDNKCDGDDYHRQRYSKSNTSLHTGYCHCQRG